MAVLCVVVCYSADELREFRDTIVSMLDTYSYERSILRTATALLNADKYMQIERLAAKHASAFSTRADYCEHCHLPLSDGSITLRITIFDCQHAFHDTCLKQHSTACPLCQHSQSGSKSKAAASSRKDAGGKNNADGRNESSSNTLRDESKEESGEQPSHNGDRPRDEEKTNKVQTKRKSLHTHTHTHTHTQKSTINTSASQLRVALTVFVSLSLSLCPLDLLRCTDQ